MFGDYVLEQTYAIYDKRILFIEEDNLDEITHYSIDFTSQGYDVIRYNDDLAFRAEYEEELDSGKFIVIANAKCYIPYDIQHRLSTYRISLNSLFPLLNSDVLYEELSRLNFDLLCMAYRNNYEELTKYWQTTDFLRNSVYSKENIGKYIKIQCKILDNRVQAAANCLDWFDIAELKATIDVYAVKYGLKVDTSWINQVFKNYILKDFAKLSSEISSASPVIVSHTMEYIKDRSDKFVIIVMDGMSEFDWKIISTSFDGIPYRQTAVFAMIPTTTSISRQCLLSGKFPIQLIEPWKQSMEKAEFINFAKKLGYLDNQIEYARGYDAEFNHSIRCGAIIINDVDDMVHGQKQGRLGMYHDINILASQKKLITSVKRFREDGFDVYISADHGNTSCVGLGKLLGTGLEVETKSHRMIVLHNFADKEALIEKYGLINYPKYYLSKNYDYLICDTGTSFDAKNENVMTHGGISIDEVIVPFIEIKAV